MVWSILQTANGILLLKSALISAFWMIQIIIKMNPNELKKLLLRLRLI
ncbi:hypothetical protein Bsph_2027 [Lysinibacillus sphaericus C3-41]|uniref:Uncharacterized protein n=1 Tax=Lysinibacillus sphaericus (strain C3-41) TaxID=444177 RepID=B1HU49_LYSSC|nr:hypothetical protein Bsph_2027 [Lysinibacillus sphaericus C3-41]